MTMLGSRRSEITEKISEAAKNIGVVTALALLVGCVALSVSIACLMAMRTFRDEIRAR